MFFISLIFLALRARDIHDNLDQIICPEDNFNPNPNLLYHGPLVCKEPDPVLLKGMRRWSRHRCHTIEKR